ncbi:MAG TPA: EF-P lysine aminoacylase EpmA [Steroidobacteraceae bacterium]|nr:EF-P lysine aminoacylase EpmA [Steroidobacteraceae bacterium]
MSQRNVDWQPTASRSVLAIRARMLRIARDWLDRKGALEVETPTLGRAAVTDVHLASITAHVCGELRYLHTSPEFAMKRLLAAGYGDVWQIGRVYRDGESGRLHNPEFTMIEWYRTGLDHHALMREVAELVTEMVAGQRSLELPRYLTYQDVFAEHTGVDPLHDPLRAIVRALATGGIEGPESLGDDRDAWLDLAMATIVGPRLGHDRLTFVYDYPASQAALARRRGPVASRFELYLDGRELANGFHELSDAGEQRERMQADLAQRLARGLPAVPVDAAFLAGLEHGLPDCAGVALGFDRLVMCAVGADDIADVIALPFDRA